MFLWVRAATGFVYLSRCPTQLPARGAEHHHAVRKAQVKHFESRHGLLQAREKKHANGRPEVAVDCLLAQPIERLLTRKLRRFTLSVRIVVVWIYLIIFQLRR
jgi:hypothetical protein